MRKETILEFTKRFILPGILFSNILLLPVEATSSSPVKDKQEKIKQIESTLSREKQKLKAFDSQEKGLLAQLSDLEQKVAQARRSVDELRKKIERDKIEMERLGTRLIHAAKSLRNAENQISSRLVALYKYARKGYVKVLASAGDLDQFWQRVTYLKAIIMDDRKMLEGLTEEKRKRETEVSRIKQQFNQKDANYKKNKVHLASLEKDLEKKIIRLMKVHKEKEFYETAVKELALAAQDLRQTLLTIEKRNTYETTKFSRFEDSKGRLSFPMEGTIIKADNLLGSTRRSIHKGIFIESDSATKVRAVFPGRVDFSGRLKGYGEVVIINHGSRFFTISAQFSRREKQAGEAVQSGEVIGSVGINGASKRARLYFEIRKGGKGLDPLTWLKTP
jgi:septal ring factor EnvC (AmiA/AmiB activator)